MVRLTWLLGAISATLAAALGYLLSLGGGYNEETLALHMWSGIFLAVLSFACYFLKRDSRASTGLTGKTIYITSVMLVSVLLMMAGHFGGSLTHGSEYLVEYAPKPIQKLAGRSAQSAADRPKVSSLDSAEIFDDAIMPVLNSKCVSCHNKDKSKGKLLLTSYDDLLRGGEDGPGIVPGSPDSSEIYKRITLPHDDKKFMPAEGKKPLTDEQVSIIEWWIKKEAPQKGKITALEPSEEIKEIFEKFYGLGKYEVQELSAPAPDTAVISDLIRQGFVIRSVAAKGNLLDARVPEGIAPEIKMESLLDLKQQVIWLQLTGSGVVDKDLEIVGQLPNLLKLNISRNAISDKGVTHLLGLSKLEYLNLYETNVSDSAVVSLLTLPKLKELYLWQTKVSSAYIDSLKVRPGLKIIYRSPE
ncbi:MAG: c-type cytochrome domain-containing protein [Bacteroidota bacterium]